jgi:hypothetical protein
MRVGERGEQPRGRGSPVMEQIYYTQCPIGYGLGASNGFQVKRLSPGYPVTGDFRHLGLRAFLPGTRAFAPAALRYRVAADGVAEVAYLTPRTHEYETERGLWGRPGGHFAHGLRLSSAEMASLRHWPAGLFGSAFWKATDPEPSLGRPPDPLAVAPTLLRREPSFPTAAALAIGRDVRVLACLFTALAAVVRDGRTLTLFDRPDRLADLIALLTLAFPEPWRAGLTFSTYHDRPDELPGFRLQGAAPDPRLNRQALLAQGFVADLTTSVIEPAVKPAPWSITLAGWLIHQTAEDRAAWDATDRRASGALLPPDEWLDRLYDLPRQLRPPLPAPGDPTEWKALGDLAAWAREAGLGRELMGGQSTIEGSPVSFRGPSWWRDNAAAGDEARQALVEHARLAEGWAREGEAEAWGRAVAVWLDLCPGERRDALLSAILNAAPGKSRPAFLSALMAAASPVVARDALRWLRSQGGIDPLLLLPLEVRAIADRTGGDRGRSFADLLARASATPASLTSVLDALAVHGDNPRVLADAARALSELLATADDRTARLVVRWALGRGDQGGAWLGPYLRAISAALDRWRAFVDRAGRALRVATARVGLGVAMEAGVPDEVFRWGVEMLLLSLPESEQPHDPAWPGAYLDRTPSGLELMRRLFTREYRDLGIKRWLDRARERGETSTAQDERVEACVRYARALKTGEARALLRVELPSIPPGDRGAMLDQILTHVASSSGESLGLALDVCRAAWPGGFHPGAEGLAGLAEALAERHSFERSRPENWFARLSQIFDRLGLLQPLDAGFEPDSLAAEILAASTRLDSEGFSPWRLRQFVLQHDAAWRALAADIGRDLHGRTESETLVALDYWDRRLVKGVHASRFFEVWLNMCEGPALAACVAARAGDLKTLPALPWWRYREHPGATDDLRDAFARLAPMAPLDEHALAPVQAWMRKESRAAAFAPAQVAPSDLVPLDDEPAASPARPAATAAATTRISDQGRCRWRCVEALSAFHRPGLGADACWQVVEGWYHDLSLGALDDDDRYIFLAWLIPRLEGNDSLRIARLANWLVRSGLAEPDRLTGWAEELARWSEASGALRAARTHLVSDLRAEWKTVLRESRERGRRAE